MHYTLDTHFQDDVIILRRMVRERFGDDAEIAFGEALNNILEHSDAHATIVLRPASFEVVSHTPFEGETHKEATVADPLGGEFRAGGFGLDLIRAMGGTIDGCRVTWSAPRRSN